jgi:capsular polysaccharide biosynthesis protein
MNINYQKVTSWFKDNLKSLIIIELICLLIAGVYFFITPRIYEAVFSISLPKVLSAPTVNAYPGPLRLLISPQEFIRPTQNPMLYTPAFIQNCMGEDTNTNRKQLISALQLGVQQRGDVVAFTLRLEGRKKTQECAHLLLTKVLNDLTAMQANYVKSSTFYDGKRESGNGQYLSVPQIVQEVRLSDSFIKPNLVKLIATALLAGIGLTVVLAVMRKRYRA